MILAAGSPAIAVSPAPSRAIAVSVEGLSKRFAVRRSWLDTLRHPRSRQHTLAVDGVDFTAYQGEIVGFLGANGAGKTTLLKMLATLVTPDSGRAEVMGFDVARQAATVRRLLAPVAPDERSLDWRLSARENLRFHGALQGLRGPVLAGRVEEVLARVELDATGMKLVGAFSSGMRQRLLIARALLSRPRILLLDEPTRSLDPLSARSFRAFLRDEIAGAQGCTVLLATHDPDEALDLCHRVTILHRGRLLAAGTPAQLQRSFAHDRYRIWTRTPGHRGLQRCVERGAPSIVERLDEAEGLSIVEFDVAEGERDPADMLSEMITAGAHVARFEKVTLTLADLMERVTGRVERANV